jgi:hypothetical protein
MRRHEIVVHIILLIFSVINFALAAPVSARGIAEDVTTTSRKRWNPSDGWWTNSADRTNTPPRLGSSDSEYRLEQELRPHDPRSPMDPNPPTPNQPQSSQGSADSIDPNASPQPSQGSTDSVNSHPLPAGSPPPRHDNPLGIDLNSAPQPIDSLSSDFHTSDFYSLSSDFHTSDFYSLSSDFHTSDFYSLSSDTGTNGMPVSSKLESPSLSRPHDSNPPPLQDIGLNSLKRPSSPPDPGPSKKPYSPSDPGPSTWALGPEPSTWTLGPETSTLAMGPEPSTLAMGPEPSTWALRPSDPGPSTWASDPLDPGPSTADPGPPTAHSPSPPSPGPLPDESGIHFSELFRGRFKRRIPGSRPVNAVQRELRGTLDAM